MSASNSRSALIPSVRAYRCGVYEVLDTNRNVYSTTQVSGGSGFIAGNAHGVYGHINPVESTTTVHTESRIWVRSLETNREVELFVRGGLSVRPGHHVLCVWILPQDRLERVVNLNTEEITGTGLIWNTKVPSTAAVLFNALARGAAVATPIVNVAYILIFLVYGRLLQMSKIGDLVMDLQVPGINLHTFKVSSLVVLFAIAAYVGLEHFGMRSQSVFLGFPPMFGLALAVIQLKQNRREQAWYKAECRALDDVMLDAIDKYRRAANGGQGR